jgi:hypothetical protein
MPPRWQQSYIVGRSRAQGVDLIFVTSEPEGYADQLGQLIKPLGKIGFILPAVVTITLFVRTPRLSLSPSLSACAPD